MSETRPLPQSEDSDSFSDDDHQYGSDALTGAAGKIVEKPRKKKSKPMQCPICIKGFQLRRQPPLHVVCSSCSIYVHKRCVPKKHLKSIFVCSKCSSATMELIPSDNGSQPCEIESPIAPHHNASESVSFIPVKPNIYAKVCSSGPGALKAAVAAAKALPKYNDSSNVLEFEQRMASVGFKSSPTQPNTLGDGACGVRALCDQLNLFTDDPMFGRDEHDLARRYTVNQAKQLVKKGRIDPSHFEPDVPNWCSRMSRYHEYVDSIFLLVFAIIQERDIVIIPVHPETAEGSEFAGNGDFRWIKGKIIVNKILFR